MPVADTSDFIETQSIGCLHEQNTILKISAFLHMVQKLLHFKFCPKSAKIAFCRLQARFFQLWTQITIQQKKQSD